MPIAVIMPKFEMAQETGKVAAWLKAEGDPVRKGEAILEVETDKLTVEVESPADGTLVGISAEPGQVVPIGQPIAYVLRAGEAWSAPPSQSAQPAAPAPPEVKPSPSVQSPVAASPLAARMAEDLGLDLSAVAGTGPRGQVTRDDIESHLRAAGASAVSSEAGEVVVRAVPAARRLARELEVDLRQVLGSGPAGRIQSEDVRAFAQRSAESLVPARALSPQPVGPAVQGAVVPPPGSPSIRRLVPLTNIRRTIGERMTASVREAPQFTVAVEADMTRALAIVEDLKAGSARSPGAVSGADQPRVTLTALLIRACAWALVQHPEANSAFLDGQVAEWDEVNIGVATAIDAGLIVPVVQGADRLGMRAIAARLADLTARAREGRLKLEDLQGGTFTVSNLGMFGIDHFTAILNPPQAAILAVGRVAKQAVVTDDDRVEVRPRSTLTLTADHRVLDGVSAARFLGTIQRALEHPGLLME
jgi:pyruvate dehydrogenase E2 component (dihydrolipoamide acetyltransferase)